MPHASCLMPHASPCLMPHASASRFLPMPCLSCEQCKTARRACLCCSLQHSRAIQASVVNDVRCTVAAASSRLGVIPKADAKHHHDMVTQGNYLGRASPCCTCDAIWLVVFFTPLACRLGLSHSNHGCLSGRHDGKKVYTPIDSDV